MTVYDDIDKSPHSGAPIECYKFTGELGIYRYTNINRAVTVDSQVFTPLSGITRTAIEVSSVLDSVQTNDISMPITCPLVIAYNFLKMPITLDVEILSVHEGTDFATDWKRIWKAEAVGFSLGDNVGTVKTQSVVQGGLSRQLNQILFQTTCNHTVYDEMCQMDPADFTTTSTVLNIKDNLIKVVATGRSNGALIVGKMVNIRTGEERIISDNQGQVVTVGYGFIDILIGDTVDMIVGCTNGYSICQGVFDNVDNFGAFKWLPVINPYTNPV